MTFLELQNQLKALLAESNVSQYWTAIDMKEYLNEGQREFAKQSRITTKHKYLNLDSSDNNSYLLPSDVVEILHVQYDGKPLDRKSISFLQNYYSGTSHFEVIGGVGRGFIGDWRRHTGFPKHWYLEEQKIHCYPRVNAYGLQNNGSIPIRMSVLATITEGENRINLPVKLPTNNKNLIDVVVNGVNLDYDTWSVINNPDNNTLSSIQLSYTSSASGSVVVSFFTNEAVSYKYLLTPTAQQIINSVNTPFEITISDVSYPVVRVNLNGATLEFGTSYNYHIYDNTLTLTLFNIEIEDNDNSIEVTIYEGANESGEIVDQHLSIDYLYQPVDMINDTDVPSIPIAYHKAILYYAAYLALIREGAQTSDSQKAMNFLQMFNSIVDRAKQMMSDPIDIDFAMIQPFFV